MNQNNCRLFSSRIRLLCGAVCITLLLAFSALAQEPESRENSVNFKTFTCGEFLKTLTQNERRAEIVTVWAHGFYIGAQGFADEEVLTGLQIESFFKRIEESCKSAPERNFLGALKDMKPGNLAGLKESRRGKAKTEQPQSQPR